MISDFFMPSEFVKDLPNQHRPEFSWLFSNADIVIHCASIELNFRDVSDFDVINSGIEALSPTAIDDFQMEFPDKHDFRVRLIDQAIHLERTTKAEVVYSLYTCVPRLISK